MKELGEIFEDLMESLLIYITDKMLLSFYSELVSISFDKPFCVISGVKSWNVHRIRAQNTESNNVLYLIKNHFYGKWLFCFHSEWLLLKNIL